MDRRCGTCGWWKEDIKSKGICSSPLPFAYPKVITLIMLRSMPMHKNDGENCPCWRDNEYVENYRAWCEEQNQKQELAYLQTMVAYKPKEADNDR